MKCTVILDNTRDEEVIIYAHQKNHIVEKIENLLLGSTKQFNGYLYDEIVKLELDEVYCFAVENNRLYAVCQDKKYLIKSRLYNIEQELDDTFIKINQSTVVNVTKIKKFDASISGALKVILKNGYTDYVSRRNLKNVKKRMGI